MIGLEDIYKVIVATVPLYFALMLGYGSVKWWRIFTPDQCNAINRFVAYFTLPLFTFEFAANIDPFHMNYRFIAADMISKAIIMSVLAFWVKFIMRSSKESYCWSITSFSLSTLTNSLVVGVPLVQAMYGQSSVDLVVQGSVVQAIIWLTLLLFVLELRRTHTDFYSNNNHESAVHDVEVVAAAAAVVASVPEEDNNNNNNNKDAIIIMKDLEGNHHTGTVLESTGASTATATMAMTMTMTMKKPSFLSLMKAVWLKLAMNPNSYACVIGMIWAFIASRWHFQMPAIMEGSILILSKAGTGTAMFSMGLFMALQKKIIACGTRLTIFGMVLRFVAGPAAMAIGSIAMGLHGDVLRVAIIQAAIPQSITSFIFAQEYSLHADVLSTAVIFGMMVSLPLLVGYYAVLEFLH